MTEQSNLFPNFAKQIFLVECTDFIPFYINKEYSPMFCCYTFFYEIFHLEGLYISFIIASKHTNANGV